MRRIAPIIAVALFCVMAVFSALAPVTDAAATETFSGNHTFTEDETYPEGSTIIIASGATVDVGSHTWTIGANSSVVFEGAAEIVCTTGSVSVGADTSMTMFGTVIKGFTHDVSYTFDGTAVFSGTSSQTSPAISFADTGTVLCASWTDSRLEITDFQMFQEVTGDDLSRIVGFSAFRHVGSVTEDEKLVSTKTIEIDPGETEKTVVGTIHLGEGTADISLGALDEIKITSYYTESDLTSMTSMRQVTDATASIATTSMAHIVASAGGITVEKATGAVSDGSVAMTDVTIDTNVNIKTLFKLVLEGIEGTSPDWLEDLQMNAADCVIHDRSLGTTKTLTSLSLVIDYDAADYLTAVANDGDSRYTVTATTVVFTEFSINRHMELDLKATVQTLAAKKEVSGALSENMVFSDLDLDIVGLDVKTLYMLYSRTGTKAIQHLLDSSSRVDIKADTFTVDADGDGSADTTASAPSAVLCTNTLGLYTMTVGFTSLDASVPVNDTAMEIKLGRAGLYMESSGSLSECLDFLLSGSNFTADAHAEIRMNFADVSVTYPLENGTVKLLGTQSSATTPPDATLMLSMDHSKVLGTTSLTGKLSYIGHIFTAEVHKAYTDPSGSLDLLLRTRDGSASFDFRFSDRIGFSVNLNLPWTMELQYYGISLQADAGVSNISLTHGGVAVDGFDITKTGVLNLPTVLSQQDFTLETRVAMEVSSLSVYTDSHTVLRTQLSDMELEVKKIGADIRHGVRADVALQKVSLSYVSSDGISVEKELGHLNLSKDLSGEVGGKGLLETVMVWVLAISVIASAVLVVLLVRLRLKEPELFMFNEHSGEEPGADKETGDSGDPGEEQAAESDGTKSE